MSLQSTLSFQPPPQKRPSAADINQYSPGNVREWIRDLPVAHMGQTTRMIYSELQKLNTLELEPNERFELLELFSERVDAIVANLQKRLFGLPLPLSARDSKIAELCNDLLASMVVGYRLVLSAGRQSSWLERTMRQRIWLTSLYRLLNYFERILCSFRILEQPTPKGLWRSIHRLYQKTERIHWHSLPIPLAGKKGQTIGGEYKKTLLLSMLSRHQLRLEQITEVQQALDTLVTHVELSGAANSSNERYSYCVPKGSDLPLIARSGSCHLLCGNSESVYTLNLRELIDLLKSALHTGEDKLEVDGVPLSRHSAEVMVESWTRPLLDNTEQGERAILGKVEIGMGLSLLHRTLSGADALAPTEDYSCPVDAETRQSPMMAPLCSECTGEQGGERLCNPDDIVVDGRDPRHHSWSSTAQVSAPPFQLTEAHVLAQGEDGYQLRATACSDARVGRGDVVGIHDTQRDNWSVGQIRWMQLEGERQMELGIRHLLDEVMPVAVTINSATHNSEPLPALVGHTRSGELALLMGYLPKDEIEQVQIDYQGFCAELQLGEQLSSTPSIMVFQLDEQGQTESDMKGIAPLLSSEQGEALAEVVDLAAMRPAYDEDKYADLWSRL